MMAVAVVAVVAVAVHVSWRADASVYTERRARRTGLLFEHARRRYASQITLYVRLTAKDGGGYYKKKKKKPAYRVCSQSGSYGVFRARPGHSLRRRGQRDFKNRTPCRRRPRFRVVYVYFCISSLFNVPTPFTFRLFVTKT